VPQVALADSLQLPADSTGKRTGMFKANIGGTDVFLPASVLTDESGNSIDSAAAAPVGNERGLVTRNIPSGAQDVGSSYLEVPGTGAALNATPVASTDAAKYRSVSIFVTGAFTATYNFEVSHDGATWVPVGLANNGSLVGNPLNTASAATGIAFMGPLLARYFRVRISAYTSGTVSMTALFSALPSELPVQQVNTELPSAAALTDTTANPTAPMVGAAHMVWDGTQWVRAGGNLDGIEAQGGTAAGAADVGNPLKTGGAYRAVRPTLGNNARGDTLLDSRGNAAVALWTPNSDQPIESAVAAPAGTERGLVTRNIPSGTQPVSAASLPLPTGATTGAKQDAMQARLDLLATEVKLEAVRALLAGTLITHGNVASGVADAGNPVKAAGVYNSAEPVLTSGQRGDLQLDKAGALTVRQRTVDTYKVIGRVAAVNVRGSLAFAQLANTDKQWLTLHHTAAAVKTAKIRYVAIQLIDVSVASILNFDLRKITTAPATGNPAIPPSPMNGANPATEVTTLALPTTGGTAAATPSYGLSEFDSGILAPATAVPGLNVGLIELYDASVGDENEQSLELRAGVLEGIAIIIRSTAAATVNAIPIVRYTEELA